VLLVRLVEGWLYAHAFVDTRGGIATALTVSLIVVDLQSIAHHRESFGATPIPVLSQLLAWLQELFASSRIPGRAPHRRRRARRSQRRLSPGTSDEPAHVRAPDAPRVPRARGLFHFTRAIDQVHVHGTWSPTIADWKGEPSMQAMWRFHTETNGWRDIAQHVTIAPDGAIWTGRDWNCAAGEQHRQQRHAARGPFMIEIVGNFDVEREKLQGAQLHATFGVIDAVLRRFRSRDTSATVRFHRQLPQCRKTCPGSGVDYGRFLEQLAAYRAGYSHGTTASNSEGPE
jgi:hypothetical protein